MKPIDKYTDGYDLSVLTIVEAASTYNHNYYINGSDLLFCKSDDDNTSEWYLINGANTPEYLGYTYSTERDSHLYKGRNT